MRKLFILTFLGLFLLFTPVVSMAQLLENDIVLTDAWGGKVDSGAKAFVDRGETWLPVETVKWYSEEQIRFDLTEKRVYVTIDTPGFQLETVNLDRTIQKGLTLNFPLKLIEGKPYINLYNLDRILGITAKPRKEEKVVDVIPEASLGYTAYRINKPRDKAVFTGKINAVWDHVGVVNRNLGTEPAIDGLDVILPTWFTISNAEGMVLNKADQRYVTDAHEKKYKVWALLSNGFDRELTRKILQDVTAQEIVIRQIVLYVSLYNLDGINLDFENMYEEDKARFTSFVELLAAALHEQNSALSVDVTVPSNSAFWSRCYDRRELGKIADYVMVMAYDEHPRLSPVSGSVASYGWVEKGIVATLADIPKEKVILGIPFYTREWEETSSNGTVRVQAKTLSMSQTNEILRENGAKPVWLEDKGQYYAEYTKRDKQYKIWLEESASLKLKAELALTYQLAGIAAWRKDFEEEQIWGVLKTVLKPAPAQTENKEQQEQKKQKKSKRHKKIK